MGLLKLVDENRNCNYDVIMKAQIIQIGNSQGIRIPKVLLEETKMSGEVDLAAVDEGILIRNISKPRSDWERLFSKLAESDDDSVQFDSPTGNFESKEWQW